MIRGLLEKELRQHGLLLAFLFIFLLGGLALIAGNALIGRAGGSVFFAVRFLLLTFVPLACLVLSHALIATEFRQKTQLFLEGLPLPRWRMLAVKFTLGLAVITSTVLAALIVGWWFGRKFEAMTPRFATLLAIKTAAWTWCVYALFFAHAFLGRYRIAFSLALLVTLIYLSGAGVELTSFGPFALVDDRFAYERHVLPVEAILMTLGLTGLFIALAFALGLVRDATVASLLAEKMSSREKVFMTFMVIAGLILLLYLNDRIARSTPVQMPGASEGTKGVARVLASAAVDAPSREETAALEKIARQMADELASMGEYLRCASLPPVFIVHRRDLSANVFEKGDLKPDQGLMVRVNVTTAELKFDQLRTWIFHEVLLTQTRGLAARERNAWVLDGFGRWWTLRETTQQPLGNHSDLATAATAAMPRDFNAGHLQAWFQIRKDAGSDKAGAFAASGLYVLSQRHGAEVCRRFLSESLSRTLPADGRGWLRDVLYPVRSRLKKSAGISVESFVTEWRTALEAAEPATALPAQP